jgi:integrase
MILLVLRDTGMRVSRLCSLRLSDVYLRYVKVFSRGRKSVKLVCIQM